MARLDTVAGPITRVTPLTDSETTDTGLPDGYKPVVQPGFSLRTLLDDIRRHFRNLHKSGLWHKGMHADLLDGNHGPCYIVAINGTDVEDGAFNDADVCHPNFNGTTPAAPAGDLNVIFQVSSTGVTAYVDVSALLGLFDHGDLTGLGDDDHTQYMQHDGVMVTASAVPVYAGTSPRLLEESPVTVDPANGNIAGVGTLDAAGAITGATVNADDPASTSDFAGDVQIDGDATIDGKLTVVGGVDPIYLELTPVDPGTVGNASTGALRLLVDVGDGVLKTKDDGGTVAPVVSIDEEAISDAVAAYLAANPPDLSAAWPIGSIFCSVVSTDPATLLGFGTWAAIGAGRVLVGQDTGDTDFDVLEETGGAKTVTLTAAQSGVPAHNHTQAAHSHATTGLLRSSTSGAATSLVTATSDTSSTQLAFETQQATPTINNNTPANAAEAHTNMPPYLVCRFWKRTA